MIVKRHCGKIYWNTTAAWFIFSSNDSVHANAFHTAGASTTSSRRLSRSAQHTVHRHTLCQKLIRHLALWTLSQISGSQMDPAICPFSSCHFFRLTVTLCVLPLPYFSRLSIRRAGAGPGGTGVRGLRIAGVPTSARHAAATGWGFTGCARQRHHCARDQCV